MFLHHFGLYWGNEGFFAKRTTEMITTDLGRRAEMFPAWASRALCIAVFDDCLIKFGASYEGIRSLGTGVEYVYLLIGLLCLSKLKMYRHHCKPLLLKVFFLFMFILKSAFKHFCIYFQISGTQPHVWSRSQSLWQMK